MIHYQLRCSADHAFDGWFASSSGFDRQAAAGLVACPQCGDVRVGRALMAPAIAGPRPESRPEPGARGGDAPEAHEGDASTASVPANAGAGRMGQPVQAVAAEKLPDGVRAVLQRVRAEVERNCENVGPAFADEVRRMHRGEAERRGVYGDSTPEQAQELADEGIEVARIPWLPRADG